MPNVIPSFVVIEGVDGVGKTTLARQLQEAYGYYYLYTLPEPFKRIRMEIELLKFPAARFFYYLSCVITFQRELKQLLDQDYKVVVDRYIYSTIAMHKAMGVDTRCVSVEMLPISLPDAIILLTCDSTERNRRIYLRATDKPEYVRSMSPLLDKAQVLFLEFGDTMRVIDTTELNPQQVFETTCEVISLRK